VHYGFLEEKSVATEL